jgi:hypothetical protein
MSFYLFLYLIVSLSICFVCRKVASHDVPLKRCARCHCMFDCSKVTNVLFVCIFICVFILLSVFLSVLYLVSIASHDAPLKRCARCHCMFYCSKVCFSYFFYELVSLSSCLSFYLFLYLVFLTNCNS